MIYLIRNPQEEGNKFLCWSDKKGGYFWADMNVVKELRSNNADDHKFIFERYADIKPHRQELHALCENYITYVMFENWNHLVDYSEQSNVKEVV